MLRNLAAALAAFLLLTTQAAAQSGCQGQAAPGRICGNAAASQGLGGFNTLSSLLDRATSTQQGQILNRGASAWTATSQPSLGLNGSVGGSVALQGATSGSSTIKVPAAAGTGTIFQLPPDNGTSGYVLQTNGSGVTTWVNNASGGTVTSVGLAMPAIFSVSGSPVTTSGTLTAALAVQSANLVFAGPSSGGASAPTFRSLVNADIPVPTLSALGGIQAINAVASNWIRSINTSGVPQLSQPAFTDISGTLAAAQCPNPGASSLGCTRSYAAVASQWINQISTSGVVSSSQPAFTDISGSISTAQLPSISNNSVIGNNSGGTAVPSPLSASQVMDMIGSTRGSILYRGASGWAILTPGTSGYVLSSNGAGADPSYISVAGTGTVQTITAGTGITLSSGATCTTNCTISQSTIANNSIMANVSGGAASPSATTLSNVLDILSSSTGAVLYRAAGGTGWQALSAGTNGQVLTMGASTPSWASAGSVSNVTITASTGLASSGTCTISTTGTCTLSVDKATAANLEAGASNKVLTSDIIYDSEVALSFSTTPTWDFNTFLNARLTLTNNISSLTCSNIKASQSGAITLVQDGTGSRTMVAGWCSQFRWAGGSRGVLSTTASAIDTLFYQCISTSICYVSLAKAQAN